MSYDKVSDAVQKAALFERPVPVRLLWPAHWPLANWIQPLVSLMPFEKVEVAVADVMFNDGVWTPPLKVEVADLVPVK